MNGTLTILVPVIVGLVQVVKLLGAPARFLPLLAVALGLLASTLVADATLLEGVIAGLSAVGLFSSGKAVLGK